MGLASLRPMEKSILSQCEMATGLNGHSCKAKGANNLWRLQHVIGRRWDHAKVSGIGASAGSESFVDSSGYSW